jgi:hypothetical protein
VVTPAVITVNVTRADLRSVVVIRSLRCDATTGGA